MVLAGFRRLMFPNCSQISQSDRRGFEHISKYRSDTKSTEIKLATNWQHAPCATQRLCWGGNLNKRCFEVSDEVDPFCRTAKIGYSFLISRSPRLVAKGASVAQGTGNAFIADSNHGAAPRAKWGGPPADVKWITNRQVVIAIHPATRVFCSTVRGVGANGPSES